MNENLYAELLHEQIDWNEQDIADVLLSNNTVRYDELSEKADVLWEKLTKIVCPCQICEFRRKNSEIYVQE